jgi:PDGF/VEGF domain
MLLLAMLMNLTSLVVTPTTATTLYQLDGGGGGRCSSRDQRDILASIPECRVRDTLVDLRPFYANRSDIVEVIPSHAVLRRCGGGCALPPHTCQAAGRRQARSVEVMLVLGIWPHGEHEVVCSRLELEEDRECECACAVREQHCRRGSQYYDPSSCRYVHS